MRLGQRELFLHINASVDGFIDGPDGQMDWHFADDEWEQYILELLASVDGMIFGRVTHELLARYWPGAADQADASPAHRAAARMMNALPKYVLTRGPYRSAWANSEAVSGDVAGRIAELKARPGRPLVVFAGAGAVRTLVHAGLVDEYRIVLNPALLGGGTSLFGTGTPSTSLRLVNLRALGSGALVLSYRPCSGTVRVPEAA